MEERARQLSRTVVARAKRRGSSEGRRPPLGIFPLDVVIGALRPLGMEDRICPA